MHDTPASTLRSPVAFVSSTDSRDTLSTTSSTVAFNSEIDRRDGGRCVVCYHGVPGTLDYCHIVPRSAHPDVWEDLKRQGWIPRSAWNHGREPQNVISLCKSHHAAFATWQFYVRFVREREEFVFVNFRDYPEFTSFHNNALRLDPNHRFAPFVNLFVWHENCARTNTAFSGEGPPISLVKTGYMVMYQPLDFITRWTPTQNIPHTETPGSSAIIDSQCLGCPTGEASPLHRPTGRTPRSIMEGSKAAGTAQQVHHTQSDLNVIMSSGGEGTPFGDAHSRIERPYELTDNSVVPWTSGPPGVTLEHVRHGHCPSTGTHFSQIEERVPRAPFTEGNTGCLSHQDINDVEPFSTIDHMRALDFGNRPDISQQGEEHPGRTSERQWGETAEDSIRLWKVRRAEAECNSKC